MTDSKTLTFGALHIQIIEFIQYYNDYCGYYGSIKKDIFNKKKDIFNKKNIISEEYKKYVCSFLVLYIILLTEFKTKDFKNIKIKRLKEGEPKFLQILSNILQNNYGNIRYNFTMELINHYNTDEIILYLITNGFISYLEKINPEKERFNFRQREFIELISAEKIKDEKLKLRWTWMGVIMAANKK